MALVACAAHSVTSILGLVAVTAAATAERPNILMILADDYGWADIGCAYVPQIDARACAVHAANNDQQLTIRGW